MAQGKVRGRIARAAISAALTGVMAFGGVMAPASVALANTITVNKTTTETEATYDFYQVFKVKSGGNGISKNDNGDYTPGDMEWASQNMEAAVYGFLSTWAPEGGESYFKFLADRRVIQSENGPVGTDEIAAAKQASNVIAFISKTIKANEAAGASVPGLKGAINDEKKLTTSDSFATKLAAAIAKAEIAANATEVDKLENATAGYYLIVPNGATEMEPVWVANPSDAENITVQHKNAQPSLLKEVKDGEDGTFAKIDDIDSGEEAYFQLTVSTPGANGNMEATVIDALPDGLTYKANSAQLKGGTFDAEAVTYSEEDNTITFKFKPTTEESVITYQATLTNEAKTGASETNDNAATLEWKGATTVENVASVATYQLDFSKVDESGNGLAGAAFAIMKGDNNYVQANGTLGTNEYYFSVDGDGKLTVPFFVDADTYTVKEQAPAGYEAIDDFTVTITSELDGELGEVKTLKAETDNAILTAEADVETGVITITVPNENEIILPITGMTPSQLGTIIGAVLVTVGAATIIARRRQGSEA